MFSSVSWSHLMSTIGHFSVLVRIKLIFRSKWLASCSKVAGQFYIYTVFSILFYSFHFDSFHFISFHWSRSRFPEMSSGGGNEVYFIRIILCGAVYTHLTCTIFYYHVKKNQSPDNLDVVWSKFCHDYLYSVTLMWKFSYHVAW